MAARSIRHLLRKRPPSLDWQLCQSDEAWEAVSQAVQPLAPRPLSPVRRFLSLGLFLLLLLAAGGLRWHSVQSERAAVEAAIGHTVEATYARASQVASLSSAEPATGMQARSALNQARTDGATVTHLRRLGRDVAVVQVALPPQGDGPALRQTRVYQLTESGWQLQAPSAAHWGALSQWESDHLLIRYYANDAQAVAEVAAQLDARYAELHQLFLGEPPAQPLTVIVDPAQPPGEVTQRASVTDPLVVASPAVYLAPQAISDAELLGQSLLLALLEDFSAQALQRYDAGANFEDSVRWRRVGQLLGGVKLWQVWQNNLPLARWRMPLVQWVFSDARDWQPVAGEVVPSFRAELCAMHRLWMTPPFALKLPLVCHDALDTQEASLSWRLIR